MTYFESAEEMFVSWDRVKKELRDHGVEPGSIEWTEANRLFNTGQAVSAQAMLAFLGY